MGYCYYSSTMNTINQLHENQHHESDKFLKFLLHNLKN